MYHKVRFSEHVLTDHVKKAIPCLRIFPLNFKYFSFEYKKTINSGKLYLLPKIHKRLKNVSGRPVISNCGIPIEKVSEFFDHHLKSVMAKFLEMTFW